MPRVGRSQAMQEIYRSLARLMQTDLTVMINGGSGTGEELVARALHDYGKREKGPFVAVNMAAIPRDLIESELFGHENRAFTGANQRSAGRFEQAEGGTLFLDEIGDMPMEAQTRLLRVLQQGGVYDGGRAHADQDQCSDHRRDQQGSAHPHPAGPTSSTSTSGSTWCRFGCRRCANAPTCPTSSITSSKWRRAKGCHKYIEQPALDRMKEIFVAWQHPRA